MKWRTKKSATAALALAATVALAGPAAADTDSDSQSTLPLDDSGGATSDNAPLLNPPTSVELQRLSSGVTISWAPASANTEIGGYNIYRGDDYVATVEGAATNWTDIDGVDGNEYTVTSFDATKQHFSVHSDPAQNVTTAVDPERTSVTEPEVALPSNESDSVPLVDPFTAGDFFRPPQVDIGGDEGDPPVEAQRPSMPTNVRATNSPDGVVLRWSPSVSNSGTIAGYNIYHNGNYVDTVGAETKWVGPLAGPDDSFSVASFDDGEPRQFSGTTDPVTINRWVEQEPDESVHDAFGGAVAALGSGLELTRSPWEPNCRASADDWRLFLDGQDGNCEYRPGGDGRGVTVYVLDSVVDIDHNAFDGVNVQAGVSSINGFAGGNSQTRQLENNLAMALAEDGEPLVRVAEGQVETNIISGPLDSASCGPSHGTKVAGLVSSVDHGVASGVTIVPVEALFCHELRYEDGSTGFGYTGSQDDLLASLDWIAEQNRTSNRRAIVNMSIGVDVKDGGAYAQRISALNDAGVLVVTSAGNDGADACDYSPAGVVDHQLTVGSITKPGDRPAHSNSGPCIDLYAADRTLTANDFTGGWVSSSGTSIAAPVVTGAAAIYWSQNPWLTPDQVIVDMKNGAAPFEDPDSDCADGVCLAAQILPNTLVGIES